MTARWFGALLLVMAGLLGAMWFSAGAFTITRSVPATPPDFGDTGQLGQTQSGVHELDVWCGDDGNYYVSGSGRTMVFNGSTWTYPSPGPLCDAARAERRTTSVAFVLVGILGALVILADGRMRQRRRLLFVDYVDEIEAADPTPGNAERGAVRRDDRLREATVERP